MSYSLLITSNNYKLDNKAIIKEAYNFFKNKNSKTAIFKPIVSDENELESFFKEFGVQENFENHYGFKKSEILSGLAKDNNSFVFLEAIIEKYNKLKREHDCILIDALNLNFPLDGFLSSLFSQLAGNIAAPVLLFFNDQETEESIAATVNYYEEQSDVLAAAFLSESKVNPNLENARFFQLNKEEEIKTCLDKIYNNIISYESKHMPPLRFESLIVEKAKANKKRIVLPEGTDDRILMAADNVIQRDFAHLIILGKPENIKKRCEELGLKHAPKAQIINIPEYEDFNFLAQEYHQLRKHKGLTEEKAKEQLLNINFFATMLIKTGRADGMVSGAIGTTADTIRPALSIIRTQEGVSVASSVFFMCLKDQVVTFSDCAINVNPSPEQIAEIAISSAITAQAFGIEPKVAMLSYSTGASGTGPDVEAVIKATQIAKETASLKLPNLKIDGPIQFDAAFDVATAKTKAPNSPLEGKATVLIFPDLNSGNIAYKAVQRTANAVAIGPILQGLNAPVNDLSRGSLVKDIVNTIAITAIQSA